MALVEASQVIAFPAPAGMNRDARRGPPTGTRVPRTRGDEPNHGDALAVTQSRSPHPRG